MIRTFVEYGGWQYPAIQIEGNKIDDECHTEGVMYTICDIEFWWDVLERPCMNGDAKANMVDSTIFYYCDSGFCASEPTEEQVIEYFRGLVFG